VRSMPSISSAAGTSEQMKTGTLSQRFDKRSQ
jgi:hypothetical protein